MDRIELLELIQKGEDFWTEFKEDISSPDELVSEICAFANAQGGKVIIGVSDQGDIVGISRDYSDEISNWTTTKLEPPLSVIVEKIYFDDKLIIVIHIPRGPYKPYFVRAGGQLISWIRTGSTKKKASPTDLQRLFQESGRFFAEEMEVEGTTIDDLDIEFLERFFSENFQKSIEEELSQSGITLEKLLENLKLFKNGSLTTAGLLLFGKNPQKYLPFCIIWALRVKGLNTTDGKFIDRKELSGKLVEQIDKAEDFLKNHLMLKGEIKGFNREEDYEISLEALREAIVNAVAHRDYTIPSNIRLFVFDDRIEVINPGKLPNTVTIENIKYGIHVERNPIIVSYLTKLKKMSQIGTGIPRMINLVKRSTGKEPLFQEIDHQFKVTIYRPQNV